MYSSLSGPDAELDALDEALSHDPQFACAFQPGGCPATPITATPAPIIIAPNTPARIAAPIGARSSQAGTGLREGSSTNRLPPARLAVNPVTPQGGNTSAGEPTVAGEARVSNNGQNFDFGAEQVDGVRRRPGRDFISDTGRTDLACYTQHLAGPLKNYVQNPNSDFEVLFTAYKAARRCLNPCFEVAPGDLDFLLECENSRAEVLEIARSASAAGFRFQESMNTIDARIAANGSTSADADGASPSVDASTSPQTEQQLAASLTSLRIRHNTSCSLERRMEGMRQGRYRFTYQDKNSHQCVVPVQMQDHAAFAGIDIAVLMDNSGTLRHAGQAVVNEVFPQIVQSTQGLNRESRMILLTQNLEANMIRTLSVQDNGFQSQALDTQRFFYEEEVQDQATVQHFSSYFPQNAQAPARPVNLPQDDDERYLQSLRQHLTANDVVRPRADLLVLALVDESDSSAFAGNTRQRADAMRYLEVLQNLTKGQSTFVATRAPGTYSALLDYVAQNTFGDYFDLYRLLQAPPAATPATTPATTPAAEQPFVLGGRELTLQEINTDRIRTGLVERIGELIRPTRPRQIRLPSVPREIFAVLVNGERLPATQYGQGTLPNLVQVLPTALDPSHEATISVYYIAEGVNLPAMDDVDNYETPGAANQNLLTQDLSHPATQELRTRLNAYNNALAIQERNRTLQAQQNVGNPNTATAPVQSALSEEFLQWVEARSDIQVPDPQSHVYSAITQRHYILNQLDAMNLSSLSNSYPEGSPSRLLLSLLQLDTQVPVVLRNGLHQEVTPAQEAQAQQECNTRYLAHRQAHTAAITGTMSEDAATTHNALARFLGITSTNYTYPQVRNAILTLVDTRLASMFAGCDLASLPAVTPATADGSAAQPSHGITPLFGPQNFPRPTPAPVTAPRARWDAALVAPGQDQLSITRVDESTGPRTPDQTAVDAAAEQRFQELLRQFRVNDPSEEGTASTEERYQQFRREVEQMRENRRRQEGTSQIQGDQSSANPTTNDDGSMIFTLDEVSDEGVQQAQPRAASTTRPAASAAGVRRSGSI